MRVDELVELLSRYPSGMQVMVVEPFDEILEHVLMVEVGCMNGNVVCIKMEPLGTLFSEPEHFWGLPVKNPVPPMTITLQQVYVASASEKRSGPVPCAQSEAAPRAVVDAPQPKVQRPVGRPRKMPDLVAVVPRPVGRPRSKKPDLDAALHFGESTR